MASFFLSLYLGNGIPGRLAGWLARLDGVSVYFRTSKVDGWESNKRDSLWRRGEFVHSLIALSPRFSRPSSGRGHTPQHLSHRFGDYYSRHKNSWHLNRSTRHPLGYWGHLKGGLSKTNPNITFISTTSAAAICTYCNLNLPRLRATKLIHLMFTWSRNDWSSGADWCWASKSDAFLLNGN